MKNIQQAIDGKKYNEVQKQILTNAIVKLINNGTLSQINILAKLSDNKNALIWLEQNGETYINMI